jgi:aldehyde:ferredoxin oxidoreductase
MKLNIWRINTRKKSVSVEEAPKDWQRMGGRGLLAQIMLDEVEPGCDPLGPENKLIFAPGLLTGHRLSSLDRISIGGKSPLTGGIKESNAGGRTAYHLAQLGIKALILEDCPEDDSLMVIHISKDGVRFDDGSSYEGIGVYHVSSSLMEKYGNDVAVALIGPGGEMKMKAAGVQNIDKDSVPSRIAARGGLGAVMGSKYIKAIVIDADGGERPPIIDPNAFKQARKKFTISIKEHPQTTVYAEYGTAAMVNMCNTVGALPTRNFSSGEFEDAEEISGEKLRQTLLERGGVSNTTHACMVGCAIKCSNVVGNKDGDEVIVSPLDYETIG